MNQSTLTVQALENWSGTSKNEKTCLRCGKTFWAWDTGRARCYLCIPPDPVEARRILTAIGMAFPGEAARNGNGALRGMEASG
ncbi:MAG: hypothetical protein ACHQ7N_16715 [Candidatus Methylomirabilales bacterium]